MRTTTLKLAALTVALVAGTVAAAEPAPPANPLGGPAQQTDSAIERSQEAREGFGMRRSRFRAANEQNLMGAALRALNEAADQALHLSDEQRKALADIRSEFEGAAREFRNEHQEELQAMQKQARELREKLQAGDEAAQAAMGELREQMQAIRENAPKFADIRANIEEVLSEDQLEFVQGAMAQLLEEAQRRGRRGQMGGPLEGMGMGEPGQGMDTDRPLRPAARQTARAPAGAAPPARPARPHPRSY